jgi:hypothetical protein
LCKKTGKKFYIGAFGPFTKIKPKCWPNLFRNIENHILETVKKIIIQKNLPYLDYSILKGNKK